jgi:large subunit ribosomal protein L10
MRANKQLLLDELMGQMKDASSYVIASYQKLTPQFMWKASGQLSPNKSYLEIAKKRVLLKALEKMQIDLKVKKLPGHIALLISKGDSIQAIKQLYAFREELENSIDIIAGVINGEIYFGKDVEMLSKLPSAEQLRAEFLSVLEAPLSQVLSVYNNILTSVIYCLENKVEKEKK